MIDKLIPNGSPVIIIGTELKGTTEAVSIYGINNAFIEYKVIWWCGGERHSEWLGFNEIEQHIKTNKKPGFVDYETNPEKLIE